MRLFAVLLILLPAAGCGGGEDATPPSTNLPSVTLKGELSMRLVQSCEYNLFPAIDRGNAVTLKNAEGTVVGLSKILRIIAGEPGSLGLRSCRFPFEFNDVPSSDFYTVEFGDLVSPTLSRRDLNAAGWSFCLTLSGVSPDLPLEEC